MPMFGESLSKFWEFLCHSLSSYTHIAYLIFIVYFWEKNLGFYTCLCCFLLCSSSHRSLQSQSDLGFTAQTLKTIMLSPRLQHRDWITRGTSCFSCSLPFSSCTLNSHSCLVPLGAFPAQQSCGVPRCVSPPEERQELQVWNSFSVLVSSEIITAMHRATFCGFKC